MPGTPITYLFLGMSPPNQGLQPSSCCSVAPPVVVAAAAAAPAVAAAPAAAPPAAEAPAAAHPAAAPPAALPPMVVPPVGPSLVVAPAEAPAGAPAAVAGASVRVLSQWLQVISAWTDYVDPLNFRFFHWASPDPAHSEAHIRGKIKPCIPGPAVGVNGHPESPLFGAMIRYPETGGPYKLHGLDEAMVRGGFCMTLRVITH